MNVIAISLKKNGQRKFAILITMFFIKFKKKLKGELYTFTSLCRFKF